MLLFITTGLQYTAERAVRDTHRSRKAIRTHFLKHRMLQYLCFYSRQLTGNVVKLSEDHLYMIPYIQGAEPCVRLSKGHKLILIELIGLHGHRVERKGFINSKICGKTTQNYLLSKNLFHGTTKVLRDKEKPALMQLKSRGVRSWILRPWNSKGLAQ